MIRRDEVEQARDGAAADWKSDGLEALPAEQAAGLMERAREARARAYAPYSGFRVGAALLDREGRIHTAANVENASYGLSTCAERAAVAVAFAEGASEFRAVAIAGPEAGTSVPPCGSCRQVLNEFGPLIVILDGPIGPRQLPLSSLLPEAFTYDRPRR